jgi:adenylate cyclase
MDSALLESIVGALAPPLERSLVFVWRRHLAATARRLLGSLSTGDASAAIGFCDVVGYTERTRAMRPNEVDELLREFDQLSYETVALGGGRVIKMIGDEVMFEAPSIVEGARIALGLIDAARGSRHVGDTRAAVASGPIISRAGDRFGAPVNLASRLTGAALPGTVLVPSAAAAELSAATDLTVRTIHAPLRLKGIGSVRAAVVRRSQGLS